jgi:hypothetical protein
VGRATAKPTISELKEKLIKRNLYRFSDKSFRYQTQKKEVQNVIT